MDDSKAADAKPIDTSPVDANPKVLDTIDPKEQINIETKPCVSEILSPESPDPEVQPEFVEMPSVDLSAMQSQFNIPPPLPMDELPRPPPPPPTPPPPPPPSTSFDSPESPDPSDSGSRPSSPPAKIRKTVGEGPSTAKDVLGSIMASMDTP